MCLKWLSVFSYCFTNYNSMPIYTTHYSLCSFSLFLLLQLRRKVWVGREWWWWRSTLSVFSYCFRSSKVLLSLLSCKVLPFSLFLLLLLNPLLEPTNMLEDFSFPFSLFLLLHSYVEVLCRRVYDYPTDLSVFSYCFKWLLDQIQYVLSYLAGLTFSLFLLLPIVMFMSPVLALIRYSFTFSLFLLLHC